MHYPWMKFIPGNCSSLIVEILRNSQRGDSLHTGISILNIDNILAVYSADNSSYNILHFLMFSERIV